MTEGKRSSDLTLKQQAFVDGLTAGASMYQAAVEAGYQRDTLALRLMVARRFPRLWRKMERQTAERRQEVFTRAAAKGLSRGEIAKRLRCL